MTRSNRAKLGFFASITLLAALTCYPRSTLAQSTLPSAPGLNFQTSGTAQEPGIGDWYTTESSASNDRVHRFFISITEAELVAAGGSITITVNEAESNGGLPDEVNGGLLGISDPTRFELRTQAGVLIDSQTVQSGAANETAVVFSPITTPGTYQVTSVTGAAPIFGNNNPDLNDDENGFSISVPIEEILIGQFQGSFQRNGGPETDTIPFFFLVGPGTESLFLRNFDLDNIGTVTYTNPNGTVIQGTVSLDARWNGGGDLNVGGDTVAIDAIADAGTWQLTLNNFNIGNQGILEANNGEGNRLPLFDTPPTVAGNFTITADTTLETTIGTAVCHPIEVTNNFFTTDIINLTPTGTEPNYTVQFRDAAGTTPLADTDGDGNVDTGILQPGETQNLTLCVTPNPGATSPDVTRINALSFMDARVRQQAGSPPPTPQFVDKTTTIPPAAAEADLSLTKTANPASPNVSSNVTYTLTVRNDGADAATNVSLLDPVPAGLTAVSSNPSQGSYDANTGIWVVGSLNNGQVATLEIVARVDTSNPITNTAQVNASDQPDPDSTPGNSTAGEDDQASVTVSASGEPSLRLVKRITNVIRNGVPLDSFNFGTFTDDPNDPDDNAPGWALLPEPRLVGVFNLDAQTPLQSGDEVEYTVYFLSDGSAPVSNASICDPIPQGTTFNPDSFGSGQGIVLSTVGTRTNLPTDDEGTFFSPLNPVNTPCPNPANSTGAVVVQLGTVNPQELGFIRFRVKID